MEITQIVPRLPPSVSGVGDYAFILARALRERHGIGTLFIVPNDPCVKADNCGSFSVHHLPRSNSTALADALSDRGVVLLHYVGYGYASRGCPVWLIRGLERWRRHKSRGRLVTMFHEVAAERGAFPSSSFFNAPLQAWLAARVARLSDVCRTNMTAYARWLERMAPQHKGRVSVQPVFSNVGEPLRLSSVSERASQLALFGSAHWTRQARTHYVQKLLAACHMVNADTVIVVGEPSGMENDVPVQIREMGILPATAVSEILLNSRAGFFNYFSGRLGKSGVFAAYCAHGVVPVTAVPNLSQSDGVESGREYLVSSELSGLSNWDRLQHVADNARSWYQAHSINRTADSVAEEVGASKNACQVMFS